MMTENIAHKFGGTSNATPESILQCIAIAQEGLGITTSAPGELKQRNEFDVYSAYDHIPKDVLGAKVTDQLLAAYDSFVRTGEVDELYTEATTARFAVPVAELDITALHGEWVRDIAPRIRHAVRLGPSQTSILGERLQAEVYEALGFYLLDPATAGHALGKDVQQWMRWLSHYDRSLGQFVLPGNTTFDGVRLTDFSRGGSDTSHSLLAIGMGLAESHNMTDFPLYSSEPDTVGWDKARHIAHITNAVGRDLGRNGTGIVHPQALTPMMYSKIPTIVRSTKDPNGKRTVYSNEVFDPSTVGQVIALSLMDVDVISVVEPGMSDEIGRTETISRALRESGVNINHVGDDGSDGLKFVIDYNKKDPEAAARAETALRKLVNGHGEVTHDAQSMVSAVGQNINTRATEISYELGKVTDRFTTSAVSHRFGGQHVMRATVDRDKGIAALKDAHAALIN